MILTNYNYLLFHKWLSKGWKQLDTVSHEAGFENLRETDT